MSSILKALKKLEEQKAARPRYEMDVSSGIVREKRTEKKRPWVVPAGMCAVALAAILGTYGVMSLKRPVQSDRVLAAAPTPVPDNSRPETPSPVTSPAALPPAPVPVAASVPVDFSPANQHVSVREAPLSPGKPLNRKNPNVSNRVTKPADTSGLDASDSSSVASAHPPDNTREHTAAARNPSIKLTGIAWQKDSASRYAVLNGVALSEGATIEGARIDEILPDKVRFSLGDRSFDITLGSQQK